MTRRRPSRTHHLRLAAFWGSSGDEFVESEVGVTPGGDITLPALATVDGRDVSVDGTYLDLLDDYWRVSGGVVNNSGSLAAYTDTLLFGSPTTEDDGDVAHDARFFFTKDGAFRAGSVSGNHWDAASRGTYSFACCAQSIASGNYSVAFASSTASNTGSFGAGYYDQATAPYSTGMGNRSLAANHAEVALASGYFAAQGDAQASAAVWRRSTTDATADVELFLNGNTASYRFLIVSDSSVGFKLYFIGRRTDANNEDIFGYVEGMISNDAGTTTIITAAPVIIAQRGLAGVAFNVLANDAQDAIKPVVTGNANPIYWVCSNVPLLKAKG
jgi:hypothetical protein